MGGGIPAGIYATCTSDSCLYISQNSKAAIIVVDDRPQLMKYLNQPSGTLPYLKAIVVWGELFGDNIADQKLIKQSHVPIYTWREFMALGEATGNLPCPNPMYNNPPCPNPMYNNNLF